MMLSREDRDLFFQVWLGLLAFVNDKNAVDPAFGHPTEPSRTTKETVFSLREKLWEDDSAIDEYIESENMPDESVLILRSWKRHLAGEYIVMRQLKKYAVFLDAEREVLWGVNGISNPISEMFTSMPVMVKTVLLPFRNQVVYDSFFKTRQIQFGHNIMEDLNEQYREIKKKWGILTRIEEQP